MATKSKFANMIEARIKHRANLCVGLDPQLPCGGSQEEFLSISRHLAGIVDQTAAYTAAYKLNVGFYLAGLEQGLGVLRYVVAHIKQSYPAIPIILDGKWGDIGSSNDQYVAFADHFSVDAVTIHNYMGGQAMAPFLDKFFCFVLCRTSNPGSGEFQMMRRRTERNASLPLFLHVAYNVSVGWNSGGSNVGLVVGATYPDELEQVNELVSGMIVLIPDVGAQGESVASALRSMDAQEGLNTPLINISRGITSADNPGAAALSFNKQIERAKPAGNVH